MESFTTAFLQLFPVRRKENVKIIQNIPPSVMALPIVKTTDIYYISAIKSANKDIIFITRVSNTKCKKENPSTAIMVAALYSLIFFILNVKDFYSIRFAIFPVSYPDFSLKISDTAFWHASEWNSLSTATGDTAWISSRKTR